jgi:membrane associated rhomboid family serine protease
VQGWTTTLRATRAQTGDLAFGCVIPLRDDNPTRHVAWVTLLLIVVNVAVFALVQPRSPSATARFDYEHAAIPCEVTTGDPLTLDEITNPSTNHCVRNSPFPAAFPAKNVLLAIVVSMFLHGSWLHLGGNMLFLWVFGNNIEDRLGPVRYLVFYLAAGVVATLTHIGLQADSTIPVIGASGAIAGVMGAYLVWFPNAPVLSLLLFIVARIQAKWWLLIWFGSQFLINPNDGVAWAAHVGGFVFGALAAVVFRGRRQPVNI